MISAADEQWRRNLQLRSDDFSLNEDNGIATYAQIKMSEVFQSPDKEESSSDEGFCMQEACCLPDSFDLRPKTSWNRPRSISLSFGLKISWNWVHRKACEALSSLHRFFGQCRVKILQIISHGPHPSLMGPPDFPINNRSFWWPKFSQIQIWYNSD